VLELALREALSLGSNDIGTEHILLALVRENDGAAARILLDFDADAEKIRNEIIRMLSGPGRRQQVTGVLRPVPARRATHLPPWTQWQSMLVGAALLGLGILIGWAIWG